MNTQPDLFSPRRNRGHDSHRMHANSCALTSDDHDAFRSRSRQILDFVGTHGAVTDRRIMEGLGFTDMNAIRPRVTELIDQGFLKEAGETNDHVTGRTVRLVTLNK